MAKAKNYLTKKVKSTFSKLNPLLSKVKVLITNATDADTLNKKNCLQIVSTCQKMQTFSQTIADEVNQIDA